MQILEPVTHVFCKGTYKYLTSFFGLIERICITMEAANKNFIKNNFSNVDNWLPVIREQYDIIKNFEDNTILNDSQYLFNKKIYNIILKLQLYSDKIMQSIFFLIFSYEGCTDIEDFKIEWNKIFDKMYTSEEIRKELRKIEEQSKKDLDLSKVDK